MQMQRYIYTKVIEVEDLANDCNERQSARGVKEKIMTNKRGRKPEQNERRGWYIAYPLIGFPSSQFPSMPAIPHSTPVLATQLN